MNFQGQKRISPERIDRDEKIKALRRQGYTYQEIAKRFRLHINTIYIICKGKIKC